MAVAAHRILATPSISLSVYVRSLAGRSDCAAIVWFTCVALALCAVALLGQASEGLAAGAAAHFQRMRLCPMGADTYILGAFC